jgi:sec-independent protein translocase protein TatB
MFFDFGAGEILGLAVIAVILVGPERLPKFAADSAKFVKKIRSMANSATSEIRDNLGPGFENLKPSDLHPKTFVKKHLASALDESDNPKPEPKIDPDLL